MVAKLGAKVEPPKRLSATSKALWRELVPARVSGSPRLTMLCQALVALDRATRAGRRIDREGMVMETKRSGVAHANPAVKIEHDAQQLFHRMWKDLGLDAVVDEVEESLDLLNAGGRHADRSE
ncbi:MAG: P27 family phage terminase small subunit [Bryobacteraceae bacterium]